jgi:hypothetical protein
MEGIASFADLLNHIDVDGTDEPIDEPASELNEKALQKVIF